MRPRAHYPAAIDAFYVARNALKNAVAPIVLPRMRGRSSLGMDGDLDAVVGALNRLAPALRELPTPVAGKTVLELGPGRTPEFSGAFVLAGADSVLALDTTLEIPDGATDPARYEGLAARLGQRDAQPFLEAVGSSAAQVARRFSSLREAPWPVRFEVFAGARLPVPTGSLDLIVSKSVLEHVSGRDLPTLVGEMNRALRADAGMAHLIDLRDHMHVSGDDGVRGDWLDALRYPDWLFRAMFSRRPTGINRLRSNEWRRLLEDRGFSMAAWETTRFPLPPGFDKASLQEPWRSYDDATLSIAWLCVGARKPTGPARPTS